MIKEIIVIFLAIVGAAACAIILYWWFDETVIPKCKEIMSRQTKIRCLCKHKYVARYEWEDWDRTRYELKCRKCGNEKLLWIYKREGGIDDR